LETFARQSMQQVLQRKLEEEVDGVLGRARYERRQEVNGVPGYRNGFGKPRRLSLSSRLYKEPVVEDLLRRGFLPLACRFTSAARSETANKSVLWKESLQHNLACCSGRNALRAKTINDFAKLGPA